MSGVGGYGYSILGYPYLQMPAAMLQAQAANGQTATGMVDVFRFSARASHAANAA